MYPNKHSTIMPATLSYCLKSNELNTTEAIARYKNGLVQINCGSPYYAFEVLASINAETESLYFFEFYNPAKVLIALMPFALRKLENSDYSDVTSPWGYNGPFFNASITEEETATFWKHLDDWYTNNKVVTEFVRFNFYQNYTHYTGKALHTLYNVRGDITNWEVFWGNLKSNTRNQFRKAEKLGLSFELHYETISEAAIQSFYDLYIGTMDRREARDSFYLSIDYFTAIYKNNPKKCAVGLVFQDGIPISTEFFLMSNDTIFSYLGGTDSRYFKLRPNEFLKIKLIKWGSENGFKYYLIGGGLSNSKEDNLYLYKKKYFPLDEDVDFYTGRKIINHDAYTDLVAKRQPETILDNPIDITKGYFPRYRE